MAEAKARPANEAFVIEGEGDEAFWIKAGAAWPNEECKGFNIQLSALPVHGRLTLASVSAFR